MKRIGGIILVFFLCFLVSCTQPIKMDTYTFYAMDTFISLQFYNVDEYQQIGKEVEKIYLSYDQAANDFKESSIDNIYSLNQNRTAVISEELKELLEFSLKMKEETKGYFNPFIGRLSHLWKEALEENKLVSEEIIERELAIMKNTSLKIEENQVTLLGDGNLDLGGVAKGYATQKAKEYLDSIECHRYLLNAGSSNLVLGDKAGGAFSVGLTRALKDGYFYTLTLKDAAIATSSIREQHKKIDGNIYSHLLNPMTGKPADFYETLSIIGQDSSILDAYSTACFAMELETLKEFLSTKGLDFIVSKDGALLYKSEGVSLYA